MERQLNMYLKWAKQNKEEDLYVYLIALLNLFIIIHDWVSFPNSQLNINDIYNEILYDYSDYQKESCVKTRHATIEHGRDRCEVAAKLMVAMTKISTWLSESWLTLNISMHVFL